MPPLLSPSLAFSKKLKTTPFHRQGQEERVAFFFFFFLVGR